MARKGQIGCPVVVGMLMGAFDVRSRNLGGPRCRWQGWPHEIFGSNGRGARWTDLPFAYNELTVIEGESTGKRLTNILEYRFSLILYFIAIVRRNRRIVIYSRGNISKVIQLQIDTIEYTVALLELQIATLHCKLQLIAITILAFCDEIVRYRKIEL